MLLLNYTTLALTITTKYYLIDNSSYYYINILSNVNMHVKAD